MMIMELLTIKEQQDDTQKFIKIYVIDMDETQMFKKEHSLP